VRKRVLFISIGSVMAAVGLAVRVNNVAVFPLLHGYDGFGHFTYIWYLAEHWRVPLSTAGWSFFHPPLYYAFMASIWKLASGTDPVLRLKAGTMVMAMLSLAHAWVSYVVVRRYFPGKWLIHLLAPGLMLFLPVHLYSVAFLGNEGLNAALCSLALLALLWVLEKENWQRAALLGLLLGLAMLTKFSALAVVGGSFATLGLRMVLRRRWSGGLRTLVIVGSVMMMVCGWYYARNVSLYGTPFKLSRDEFMVQYVERVQTKGKRNIWEYVLFDPMVIRRPTWPRGLPISGVLPENAVRGPLRESVWTGMYANAWFDGFGGWVLPPITESERSRRAGQILLALALVPTILVFVGLATAIRKLWKEGWDDTLVAMLLTFTAMLTIFIYGTRIAPLHAAIKATYLIPVSAIFSFWFALGLDRLGRSRPAGLRWAAVACLFLGITSVTVFTHGLVSFGPKSPYLAVKNGRPDWLNEYGVVYYAGGFNERAKEMFESASRHNWHLAYENLAAVTLELGRPLEALYYLRNAARLKERQAFGLPRDRLRFNLATKAEYLNSMAVIYHQLGWSNDALEAARQALARDGSIPEAHYNLGVLKLERALDLAEDAGRWKLSLVEQAGRHFFNATIIDPAFFESSAMLGVVQAMTGKCDNARATIERALEPHPGSFRKYPVVTGRGIPHAASIRRRRHIESLPENIDPRTYLDICKEEGVEGA